MPYLTTCPTCRRPLRIQEQYAGRQIACPVCDTVFVAPHPPPEADAQSERRGLAPPENEEANEGYWIESPHANPPLDMPELRPRRRSRKRERARALLLPPAICLIITGALTVCIHAGGGLYQLLEGQPAERDIARAQRLKTNVRLIHSMQLCLWGGFALGGAYVGIAGIYMLNLRSHAFAMSGAYLAMIPCCVGIGCFFGLPLGIWSLVVLYNSEVKSAFH